ncbi:hypothetical protein MMC18_000731 [Xylographa bjoerkii]|nr:hypothetical protein [Xylographa bjoerkii]
MGSSSSKAARTAAGAARRQFPKTASPPNPASTSMVPPPPGPTVYPKQPHANSVRDDTINRDAADPDFARSLRSLGPVTPSPTFSNSSVFNSAQQNTSGYPQPQMFPSATTNPALQILDARNRLTDAAEAEFSEMGRRGFQGKQFLDVVLIRQALMMRDEKGMTDTEIEKRLGLKNGVIARLGRKGTVGDVSLEGAFGG